MTFSAANVRRAVANDDRSRRATDGALCDLYRRHPGRAGQAGANVTLWIIGRTYATRIQRKIPVDGRRGGRTSRLAARLPKHARRIDDVVGRLRRLVEPLDPDELCTILDLHGGFIALIQPVLRKKQSPRSFASRYMQFDNPAAPTIDSYADAACRMMIRWQNSSCLYDLPADTDDFRAWYDLCFWQLYQQVRAAELRPTVKHLDYYLLSAGGAMA